MSRKKVFVITFLLGLVTQGCSIYGGGNLNKKLLRMKNRRRDFRSEADKGFLGEDICPERKSARNRFHAVLRPDKKQTRI